MSLGSRSSPSRRSCSWRAARQWTSLCRKLGRCHFLKCQLTALRLSPGERGKETKVPVAFQRRLARAQFHVPDLEGLVPGCRHDGLAVGRKNARRDRTPAIF